MNYVFYRVTHSSWICSQLPCHLYEFEQGISRIQGENLPYLSPHSLVLSFSTLIGFRDWVTLLIQQYVFCHIISNNLLRGKIVIKKRIMVDFTAFLSLTLAKANNFPCILLQQSPLKKKATLSVENPTCWNLGLKTCYLTAQSDGDVRIFEKNVNKKKW